MEYNFPVTRTTHPKPRPEDESKLGFAKYFTDHMFVMDWDEGQGWHDGRVVPHAPIEIEPASCVLHYAQMMFEGMKAYKTADGHVQIFRPDMNIARMARTSERMCIPELPGDLFLAALKQLIWEDRDWIPSEPDTSLYIRPFIIATDAFLGVAPSKTYLFCIILSPSGAYYASGLKPVGIWIEDDYVRAVRGGMGFAKTGGNYACSLAAQVKAHDDGYSQVLWLDGEIVTPMLNGSILPGITRDSVIHVCKHWGLPVEERKVSVYELLDAQKNGTLEEVFVSGTAAVALVAYLRS